jgi:transposase-like protein
MNIDEAKTSGEWFYLWAAIDFEIKEGNIGHLPPPGRDQAYLNAYIFIRKVLGASSNGPLILVDCGSWHSTWGFKPVWLKMASCKHLAKEML